MHPLLEKHLGQVLSAADVAEYLQCDITTVYRNYKALGGVRIGTAYRFFEQRLINALLGQEEKNLDRPDKISEKKVSILSAKQKRSEKVGSEKTSRIDRAATVPLADPHDLLA